MRDGQLRIGNFAAGSYQSNFMMANGKERLFSGKLKKAQSCLMIEPFGNVVKNSWFLNMFFF